MMPVLCFPVFRDRQMGGTDFALFPVCLLIFFLNEIKFDHLFFSKQDEGMFEFCRDALHTPGERLRTLKMIVFLFGEIQNAIFQVLLFVNCTLTFKLRNEKSKDCQFQF